MLNVLHLYFISLFFRSYRQHKVLQSTSDIHPFTHTFIQRFIHCRHFCGNLGLRLRTLLHANWRRRFRTIDLLGLVDGNPSREPQHKLLWTNTKALKWILFERSVDTTLWSFWKLQSFVLSNCVPVKPRDVSNIVSSPFV